MQPIDSKIISFVRFPMIVGIVLIHSRLPKPMDCTATPIYDYVVEKGCIGTFMRVCVPLFFMISGYLFFANVAENFGKTEYFSKLKSRLHSLLKPYLFYNALAVVLFLIMGLMRPDLQSGFTPVVSEWNAPLVVSLFWDYGKNIPIVPQFWFIRNLMVIVLLTPFIYFLIKKVGYFFVSVLGCLWVLNVWEFGIPGTMGLFFFSLGAAMAIKGESVFDVAVRLRCIGFLYPMLALVDILTKTCAFNIYVHNVAILSGMLFVWYWVGNLLAKYAGLKMNALLSASTFFLFAVHEPYHGKFTQLFLKMMPTPCDGLVGDVMWTVYYFLWSAIWTASIVCLFALIRKVSPRVAVFLSGGR